MSDQETGVARFAEALYFAMLEDGVDGETAQVYIERAFGMLEEQERHT